MINLQINKNDVAPGCIGVRGNIIYFCISKSDHQRFTNDLGIYWYKYVLEITHRYREIVNYRYVDGYIYFTSVIM